MEFSPLLAAPCEFSDPASGLSDPASGFSDPAFGLFDPSPGLPDASPCSELPVGFEEPDSDLQILILRLWNLHLGLDFPSQILLRNLSSE